jgi:hypothetical protein
MIPATTKFGKALIAIWKTSRLEIDSPPLVLRLFAATTRKEIVKGVQLAGPIEQQW